MRKYRIYRSDSEGSSCRRSPFSRRRSCRPALSRPSDGPVEADVEPAAGSRRSRDSPFCHATTGVSRRFWVKRPAKMRAFANLRRATPS